MTEIDIENESKGKGTKHIKIPPIKKNETEDIERNDPKADDREKPALDLLKALWRSPDKTHQIGLLDRQTNHFRNIPVKSLAEAMELIQKQAPSVDLYFACAEYETPNNRKAANASGACAFWMDIDCGKDKAGNDRGYATAQEAEDAVQGFCTTTGLPTPTQIVDSGGGLHVYWVLDDAVLRDSWKYSASKLKALTKQCDLFADDSRTADIASVLRIPGTLNHKYKPARPVVLKHASTAFIECETLIDAIDAAHNRLCKMSANKIPIVSNAASIGDRTDTHEYGPPDIDRLASALKALNPDCDEETWKLKRLAPMARAAKENPELAGQLNDLAKSWSSGSLRGEPSKAWATPGNTNGLTGEEAFDTVWKRFTQDNYTGNSTTLGTIYHDAVEAGWKDATQFQVINNSKEETTTVPTKIRGPLAYIQGIFALLLLSGKVWLLDKGSLSRTTKSGMAPGLALSNRTDGKLLIVRELKKAYPEENAQMIAKEFFESPETTFYDGVEFNPAGTTDGCINLWTGPTITPEQGKWKRIQYFLFKIICNGDKKAYKYLLRFIAHALQRPREKPGILIILLGGQGTGKGTVAVILRRIWTATFLQVHNISEVTGTFNSSLERAFIVFMDEALFVGDRRATDALKSLVTEPVIQINEKHQPVRQIGSFHRYIAATNAEHFKHTEKDDRWDFVLRVSEERKGDHSYWQELYQEIENGGVEAMAQDLLGYDLSEFNVRNKPQTQELLEQKLMSLEPVQRWWYDCLVDGRVNECKWPEFIATNDVIEWAVDAAGGRLHRRPTPINIIRAFHSLCPSAQKHQKTTQHNRQRGLALPSLDQARAEFEVYVGSRIEW